MAPSRTDKVMAAMHMLLALLTAGVIGLMLTALWRMRHDLAPDFMHAAHLLVLGGGAAMLAWSVKMSVSTAVRLLREGKCHPGCTCNRN